MTPDVLAEVAVALDEARATLGLAPDPGLVALRDERIICFAPPELHDPNVPLPSGLRSFHPGPMMIADPLPEAVLALGRERPLVYATLGTVFNDPAYDLPFFPSIRAGLHDAPVDLLMTVGPNVDPSYLGEQRTGVHVARYVPQRAVLERCAVVICHGGYGTLLEAIDAAVPLIVVPFGADQHINAATVKQLGIGSIINEEAVTPQAVHAVVERLLANGSAPRQRIGVLRDSWRAFPGPAEAADTVLGLAR